MDRHIRVAFLSRVSRLAGGIFYSARSLAQSLAAENVAVRAYGPNDAHAYADAAKWYPIPVEVTRALAPNGYGYAPRLKRGLTDFDPHIVHVHGVWNYDLRAASNWCKSRQRPLVVSPRGMLDPWALAARSLKKSLARWAYVDNCLRGAACIHSLCPSETRAIDALGLGVPIFESPNGITIPARTRAVKATSTERTLLFLARLHEKKGLAPLIDAWSILKQDGAFPAWRLVIAGWGENRYVSSLHKKRLQCKSPDSIQFVGAALDEAKAQLLCNADGFVLPSYSEGMPMSILEAWSYGLPVLMTKECNLEAGFSQGAAVEVTTDASELATALRSYISMTDEQREEIGMRGRRLVEERFAWGTISRNVADMYRQLL